MTSRVHFFDTLDYYNQLRTAGVPEQQAEAHAHATAKLVDEQLATKHDLRILETRLAHKLTLRVGTMLAGAVTLLSILLTFFHTAPL